MFLKTIERDSHEKNIHLVHEMHAYTHSTSSHESSRYATPEPAETLTNCPGLHNTEKDTSYW